MKRARIEPGRGALPGAEPAWRLASAVARWLLAESKDPALALAGLALAQAELAGDSRIDLWQLAATPVAGDDQGRVHPSLTDWLASLTQSALCGEDGVLVLVSQRWLYWRRLYRLEQKIGFEIRRRSGLAGTWSAAAIEAALTQVYGSGEELPDDPGHDQRSAVRAALGRSLFVLTGGPGTGKTHTIARLIKAWRVLAGAGLRVALAAPTGKAARRMSEALAASAEAIGGAVPESHTLHRLLGWQAGRSAFRHHEGNPLLLDLLIVDESSMIDLGLMQRLLDALPPSAALVLVGDAEQLAPVEAGSVFADIDQALALCQHPARLCLRHNFRAERALAEAAGHIRAGDSAALFACMAEHPQQFSWVPAESTEAALAEWQKALADTEALPFDRWCLGEAEATTEAAFAAFASVRILAAPRQGAGGVLELNPRFERALRARAERRGWPSPRLPIMVTENLPALDLANGDIGVSQSGEFQSACLFPGRDGYRRLPRAALGRIEGASVLTVHKAQGSEFDEVWLLLPAADSPLLSRQWLYTAFTRARRRITLFGTRAALVQAVLNPKRRESGLAEACWDEAVA